VQRGTVSRAAPSDLGLTLKDAVKPKLTPTAVLTMARASPRNIRKPMTG